MTLDELYTGQLVTGPHELSLGHRLDVSVGNGVNVPFMYNAFMCRCVVFAPLGDASVKGLGCCR